MLFFVLYVWSTYSPAVRGSPRHVLDLALAVSFAVVWVSRFVGYVYERLTTTVRHSRAASREICPARMRALFGCSGLLAAACQGDAGCTRTGWPA
mgnify:CR=1 FL=1